MAAHDEKISQNRRRLFKALSAAPVVATLSPGEALARHKDLAPNREARPERHAQHGGERPGEELASESRSRLRRAVSGAVGHRAAFQ